MSNPNKPVSAVNQYLNLAGAPWSPHKPNRVVTPPMLSAGLSSAVLISLAAYFTPASNPWLTVAKYGGGVLGGVAVIGFSAVTRRREARGLSEHHEHLVIDTNPGQGIATSSDIMARVAKNVIHYNELTTAYYVVQGMGYSLLGGHFLNSDYAAPVSCFLGTAAVMLSTTNSERRRQFERIASGEWVITDQGDAVAQFQDEDRKKLLSARVLTMTPVPARTPERK